MKSQLVGDDLQSKFMELSTIPGRLTLSSSPQTSSASTRSTQIQHPVVDHPTSRTLNKSKVNKFIGTING